MASQTIKICLNSLSSSTNFTHLIDSSFSPPLLPPTHHKKPKQTSKRSKQNLKSIVPKCTHL
ncbi:hypothetical protein Sjap_001113 [Stephania japonica]|uniref:Uncharacterized protein n=1 Tax=Stephania japonica TaxID=461633 RepID=A0AAP0KKW5_9MAGN